MIEVEQKAGRSCAVSRSGLSREILMGTRKRKPLNRSPRDKVACNFSGNLFHYWCKHVGMVVWKVAASPFKRSTSGGNCGWSVSRQ